MKDELGPRTGGWPSAKPVWTLLALGFGLAAFAAAAVWHHRHHWTELQRRYVGIYLRTQIVPLRAGHYRLLWRVEGNKRRLAVDRDLTDPAVRLGTIKLETARARLDTAKLRAWLKGTIYQGTTPWASLAEPWWVGALTLGIGIVWALPKDLRRARIRRIGRRLRGPELVSTREFNERNRATGIGFANESPSFLGRLGARDRLQVVRIPREREAMHLLIMGDSGTGKSALIRQLLVQIEARGETAIVYDPALEYTPRFFRPERGDLILNPLDRRMPYWSPGDEVSHEAEALTLAASLFPDHHRENPFFVEGPRKVFAHLLTLRPSPQELTHWLSHEEEIDRRVQGTELAALVYPSAAPQRAGVLASLSMVADSLRLLPRQEDTERTWSAADWARKPTGWLFLTSTPEFRKRLLPLTSLWLDLLVLRLMNQGMRNGGVRSAWFVLDELASLQKLPQLHTAITENRKSGNPVVLGFQGRSQLEARYGREAEAMFSQPATKVFLRTSEPHSAKWISDTIGEIEVERLRESRSSGEFPHTRKTQAHQLERRVEPLIIPSEVMGLDALNGYLKSGNLVVRLRFPYLDCRSSQEAFVPRPVRQDAKEAALSPVPQAPEPAEPPVFFQ